MNSSGERRKSKYIIGNWKMHKTREEVENFFKQVGPLDSFSCQKGIAPQFIHLGLSLKMGKDQGIQVGAQNCCHEKSGAFTGEVSVHSLTDFGADFVIIGHSERRQIFKESDSIIRKKIDLALSHKLTCIICVGETLDAREAGQTLAVVSSQIRQALEGLNDNQLEKILIAYEPVWAIGTGKNASPQQAEEVHAFIRSFIQNELKLNSQDLPILYGGSVRPSNIQELLICANIDGGLIGGASLAAQEFKQMCGIASNI